MSPVQTTYASKQSAAFEGQDANMLLKNITSRVVETADGIAFGRAVKRGTSDNQCLIVSDETDSILGVTIHTTAWTENSSDEHLYEQYREANIMDFGECYVYTEQSVVPGDPVFFRHTATTSPLDVVGRFRKDDGSGLATRIKGATFESTTSAGGIAKIKLVGVETENVDTVTATSGAISLLTDRTLFDTTAGASTATLADGYEGQEKELIMTVDGGDQVVTPANLLAGTTITFADAGDAVKLVFTDGSWSIVSNNGAAVA